MTRQPHQLAGASNRKAPASREHHNKYIIIIIIAIMSEVARMQQMEAMMAKLMQPLAKGEELKKINSTLWLVRADFTLCSEPQAAFSLQFLSRRV